MKTFIVLVLILMYCKTVGYSVVNDKPDEPNENNVFVITLDGLRWQELFQGADSSLINDTNYTTDTALLKHRFWDSSEEKRREKLMPFFWNVIAKQGQLFGNRNYHNNVNVSNAYALSYPGYNEIFTGKTDLAIYSNEKKSNKNVTMLEYLNSKPSFAGKVAAFTSWDAFPFILNKKRSKLYINCTSSLFDKDSNETVLKSYSHAKADGCDNSIRSDYLTYTAARDYILKAQPRVVHIGLGGTDKYAHSKKYGEYLNQANLADGIISQLWQLVQASSYYKNNTTFIITTDHGRGSGKSNWHNHGFFVKGSSQTWLALMGNGVRTLGENKHPVQLYQKQIAGTIGYFLNIRSYSNYSLPVTYFSKMAKVN